MAARSDRDSREEVVWRELVEAEASEGLIEEVENIFSC